MILAKVSFNKKLLPRSITKQEELSPSLPLQLQQELEKLQARKKYIIDTLSKLKVDNSTIKREYYLPSNIYDPNSYPKISLTNISLISLQP